MKTPKTVHRLDQRLVPMMKRTGFRLERYLIGVIFIWFGSLKVLGEESATSIIAKSVYWWDAELLVPVLGYWELAMGFLFFFPQAIRLALLLFFLRLPGTFLALLYHWEDCFQGQFWVPTIQGQYLLKELTLVGAALVIGGHINVERGESSESGVGS